MKLKPQRSVNIVIYMATVTCGVVIEPTVPLAASIIPQVFGWRNWWVLDHLQDKLRIIIYGYPPAPPPRYREMTDEEWFGWTA
jgi:hypothetical protein